MDKLLEIEQLLHDIEVDRIVELESYQKDILQDIILTKVNEALKLIKELKKVRTNMKLKVGDKVRIKDSEDKTIWEITEIIKDREGTEFVSCMVDTADEEDYSDVSWYEEELELVENDTNQEVQMFNLTKEQVIKVVEDYFEWQLKTQVGLLAEATEDSNKNFINTYLKTLNNINNIISELDLLAYRYRETDEPNKITLDEPNKITLDDVKKFAEWQMEIQNKLGAAIVDFDDDGVAIVNPWVDCTGRYELSNKEAIREYGVENYTSFISRVIQAIELQKG